MLAPMPVAQSAEMTSRNLGRFCALALLGIGIIATLVLTGWILGVESLKRLAPGFVAMNPATAVCFLLLAAALSCKIRFRMRTAHWLAVGFAFIAAFVGVSRLLSDTLGWKIHVDELLFATWLSGPAEPLPNRMAP